MDEKIYICDNSEKNKVENLWKKCFNDSESFVRWLFDERFERSKTFCLSLDGKVVTAMQTYPYNLLVRNKIVNASMLMGVSTDPEYTGRGLMKKVFREMIRTLREDGKQVVFHTPAVLPMYYGLLHYDISNTKYLEIFENKTCKNLVFEKPSLKLYSCYEKFHKNYSGIVVRSRENFEEKCRDYMSDGGKALVFYKDNEVKAYMICFETDEKIMVEETVYELPEYAEKLINMLKNSGKKASVKLPPDFLSEGQIKPQGVMGLCNISDFCKRVFDDESIVFELTDGVVPENNGVFDLSGKKSNKKPAFALNAGRFLQFAVGYKSLSELAYEGKMQVFDDEIAFMADKKYPKQKCYVIEMY